MVIVIRQIAPLDFPKLIQRNCNFTLRVKSPLCSPHLVQT